MIHGNGIDIIDINRIRKVIKKYGNRFKKRCFSISEIERSEKRLNSVESYAKRYAAKEACTKAGLKLLEPVMRVEVITPEDYMGDVIGDLNSRRGQVSTTDKRGNATVISAMVPLANMFGYINNLRSMSQGRAQYSMFFDHYSKVPQNVQDEVTKKMA